MANEESGIHSREDAITPHHEVVDLKPVDYTIVIPTYRRWQPINNQALQFQER